MSSSNKPAIQSVSQSKVPRDFILTNGLERSGQFSNVQYGLSDDNTNVNYVRLEYWDCTIIYYEGQEPVIFDLKVRVPLNFPDVAPIATFSKESIQHARINRMCNSDGTLNSQYLSATSSEWNNHMELPEFLMLLYNKIKRN